MLALAVWLAVAAAAPELPKDIFIRDAAIGARSGLQRLTTDLLLGRPQAAPRLEASLANSKTSSRDDRHEAYLQLCGFYFREQRFSDGVRACAAGEAMEKGSAGNMIDLNRAYQAAGPVSWSSDAVRIPLLNGQLTTARRGPVSVVTLIDTGAEIGIVAQGAAMALKALPLGSPLQIGTTTTPIEGKLVQIDAVTVGGAKLRRLTALVIPDEQAEMMGAQLVIPLPALIALGRMAFVDHGKALALGKAAPPLGSSRAPLYWDESGVGFAARFAGGIRGVHFDSGSEQTWLFPAARPALSEAERATEQQVKRSITGLGGERVENAQLYRNVTMSLGGSRWSFLEIEMAEKDENGEAARIGTELFERYRTVVLDFRRMELSVRD